MNTITQDKCCHCGCNVLGGWKKESDAWMNKYIHMKEKYDQLRQDLMHLATRATSKDKYGK